MSKPKSNRKAAPGEVHPGDVFHTPPYAWELLLPYVRRLEVDLVWESCAGEQYLACWIASSGYEVVCTDLSYSLDQDRFQLSPDKWGVSKILECTNFPFSIKYKLLKLLCEQGHNFAALAPSDSYFAAKECWPLIDRYGLQFIIPDKRIDYRPPTKTWEESSAQMNTGWITRGLKLPQEVNRVRMNKPSRKQLTTLAPIWEAQHKAYLGQSASHQVVAQEYMQL